MLHRTETNLSYTLATFGEARALKNFESWIVSTGLGFFKTEGDLVSDFHLYTERQKKIWCSFKNGSFEYSGLRWFQNKGIF